MALGRQQVQQKPSEGCRWPLEAADLDTVKEACALAGLEYPITTTPSTKCQGQIGRGHRSPEEELGLLLTSLLQIVFMTSSLK